MRDIVNRLHGGRSPKYVVSHPVDRVGCLAKNSRETHRAYGIQLTLLAIIFFLTSIFSIAVIFRNTPGVNE